MRVLIFGAGGQVGRALTETAPPAAELITLDRRKCDIRSREQIGLVINSAEPDLVFNAAAFTAVDEAETAVAEAMEVNAAAPANIALAARAAGARTKHLSPDYVFDGRATRPYRPDDPPNPLNVYGRSKLAGEVALRQADPTALTVRTAWVYSSTGSNFVTNVLRMLRERPRLQIVADQIGTPTRAQSVAAALWELADAGASGLLHYSDGGSASRQEYAQAIQDQAYRLGLLDRKIAIEAIDSAAYTTPASRPTYSVLDASHAWQIIGSHPVDWCDNLRLTLAEIGRAF
jgi:dTDP-4-dehydrorhamnose reductase